MSGNNITIEQFFIPVKIQSNKTNNVCEHGIKNIPKSQTRKVDSRKLYHLEKYFGFLKNCFWQPKAILPEYMVQKLSIVRL